MKRNIALFLLLLLSISVLTAACLQLKNVADPSSASISNNGLAKLWTPPSFTIIPSLTFTVIPSISFPALSQPVLIPDTALSTRLHTICGKAMSEDLLESDLASLSGMLDLSDLGIADATGIEYCINISGLILAENQLSDMPENMDNMVTLSYLNLSGNEFTTLPDSVTAISALTSIDLSYNSMESLPDAVCTMPNLSTLVATNNRLYSLPTNIGQGSLAYLVVPGNRIGTIPSSIGQSTQLVYFDIRCNRLTSLPSNLSEREFQEIYLDFNFLDVASGTPARQEINQIVATVQKAYNRQLLPLQNLTAEPGTDQILLSWEAAESYEDGAYKVDVVCYYIYRMDGSTMVHIETLEPEETQYALTGLALSTDYTYRIGIEYEVTEPGFTGSTRHYTDIAATTLAQEPEPSTEETATVSPADTASLEPTSGSSATESDVAVSGSAVSMPGWALVLFIFGGILLCGAIVVIILLLKKRPK